MIILYNPPSSAGRKPILPLSLLALGSVLEDRHDYLIVDGNLGDDPVPVVETAVRDGRAPVLAVTVMPGPQLNHAVPLSRRIKAAHPEVPVVWGGYFPSQHWEVCLLSDCVDLVVRGHGERVIQHLAQVWEQGGDPGTVPGVASRDPSTGEIAETGVALPPDPERVIGYPYHRVPMARYVRSTFLGRRTLPHHASYGCPFRCNFCAVVNVSSGRWVAQSAAQTADVIRGLVGRWGADGIEFYDNNFFAEEERTAEFCDRIAPLGVRWWAQARIDTLMAYEKRTWELMRDSGLKMVFVGAESGSDETLGRMNKGGRASTEHTLAFARRARAYDIVPEMSFVLGSPPDPGKDARQTMAFVRRVKHANPETEVVFYVYAPVPLPGELYETARDEGFRFPTTLDEWVSPRWRAFAQRRGDSSPWLEPALRREIRDFQRVLNAYYPTATDPNLTGPRRLLLRAASAWRYATGVYRCPVELRALGRIVPYQRPETAGF